MTRSLLALHRENVSLKETGEADFAKRLANQQISKTMAAAFRF